MQQVFIGAALLITTTSLFLLIGALFPQITGKTREVIENSQGRTFLTGVVNLLFLVMLVFVSQLFFQGSGSPRMPIIFIPVFVIFAVTLIGTLVGMTSITHLIGERILPEQTQPKRNINSAIILILALLTPVIGWYLFLPYTVILGFGGIVTSIYREWRQKRNSGDSNETEE